MFFTCFYFPVFLCMPHVLVQIMLVRESNDYLKNSSVSV